MGKQTSICESNSIILTNYFDYLIEGFLGDKVVDIVIKVT
jgi:hypothetical protein